MAKKTEIIRGADCIVTSSDGEEQAAIKRQQVIEDIEGKLGLNDGWKSENVITNINRLWETWRDDIIDFYAMGMSDVQLRATIYHKLHKVVSKQTFEKWIKDHAEFAEIVCLGRELSQSYWEEMAANGVAARDVHHAVWKHVMSCRFKESGWSENASTDKEIKIELNIGKDEAEL